MTQAGDAEAVTQQHLADHDGGVNTPAAERTDLSIDFVAETRRIGEEYEKRRVVIETHIREHKLLDLWREHILALRKRHGLRPDSGWHETAFAFTGINYSMEIDGDSLYFSGRDYAGDEHSFYLPLAFLSAETREASLSDLDAKFAAQASREKAAKAEEDKKRLARDEAEYERLRAALGKGD